MVEEKSVFDMKRIVGTLKYGDFDGTKRKYTILAYVAFSLTFIGVGIGLGLTLVIKNIVENGGIQDAKDILSILGCMLVALGVPGLFGVIAFKNEKARNDIKKWLLDAVELRAYVREIGVLKPDTVPWSLSNDYDSYRIRVEFEYDGVSYKYESRGKEVGSEDDTCGYHRVWKDYINKKVNILYSPSYKEVMILKN